MYIIYIYMYIYAYICVYIYEYMCVCVYIYIYIYIASAFIYMWKVCVCVCVCVCVWKLRLFWNFFLLSPAFPFNQYLRVSILLYYADTRQQNWPCNSCRTCIFAKKRKEILIINLKSNWNTLSRCVQDSWVVPVEALFWKGLSKGCSPTLNVGSTTLATGDWRDSILSVSQFSCCSSLSYPPATMTETSEILSSNKFLLLLP
jgi:hypothetical protein